MPIYEYQCDGCQAIFEVRQKISDPPPASHACGSDKLHRVLSATTFVLKGTGWYKTDYADKPAPKEGAEGAHKGDGNKAEKADKGGQGDKADNSPSGQKAKAATKEAAAKAPPAKGETARNKGS